jgi:DnaD/phage-associated family protein
MPNRIIKESVCTSDNINQLSAKAETFFYRLMVCCDDHGRMDARSSILRAKCYPLRVDSIKESDINDLLQELKDADLIIVYSIDDRSYLQYKKWKKHQQVRANKSKYPDPPSSAINCNQLQSPSSDINCNQELANVPVTRESIPENRESITKDVVVIDSHAHAMEIAVQAFGRTLNPIEYDYIKTWVDDYGGDLTVEAIKRAVGNRVVKPNYIGGILNTWKETGLRSIEEINEYEDRWKKAKGKNDTGTDQLQNEIKPEKVLPLADDAWSEVQEVISLGMEQCWSYPIIGAIVLKIGFKKLCEMPIPTAKKAFCELYASVTRRGV